jgi:parallel beta-helix repeat protein
MILIGLASNIQQIETSGTIHIRADGSVEPSTVSISVLHNMTYTLIGNINDSIIVERSNITVDGVGYDVRGRITLAGNSNVTIKNIKITTLFGGIYISDSSNNQILRNTINSKTDGIVLLRFSSNIISGNKMKGGGISIFDNSLHNIISGNIIEAENLGFDTGLSFWSSSHNYIRENIIANYHYGIFLDTGSANTIYHNNFVNNIDQAFFINSPNF